MADLSGSGAIAWRFVLDLIERPKDERAACFTGKTPGRGEVRNDGPLSRASSFFEHLIGVPPAD
jgi:hypothetical protein